MKNAAKHILLFLFTFIICTGITSAQEDVDKIRSLIAMKNSAEKIEALHNFQKENPQNRFFNRATQEIFNTYLSLNNTDSALQYAHKYIQALPEQSRNNGYNGIAYNLALKEIGLDTALVYSSRAVESAESNTRYLNIFKDTKAFVLFKKGDAESALEIQTEAIKGNENDPEYSYHLALYLQGTGKIEEALKWSAWAVFNGDPGTALNSFNEWSKNIDEELKEKIVMNSVNAYLDSSGIENQTSAKSTAAAFMAQTNANIKQAKEWTKAAVETIDNETPVENYISFKKNIAIVEAADNNIEEALSHLEEVRNLVDPWSGDYWLTLGRVYENLSEKEKALDAYISGLIAYNNPQIMEAAKTLTTEEEIQNKIEKMKEDLSSINIGEFNFAGKTTDKVVLAELFTGAECPPCVAADHAFDELAEYYPRNVLAILEYHAHIPGPDPLTNPKGWERYSRYGGDFGTPTVFFEGTEKMIGGGPDFVTSNRFNVYNHAIKKYMNEQPGINISGNAKREGNKVDITISVKQNGNMNDAKNPKLHIAITEKQVDYTGGNGVSKHIFVVRDLVESAEGLPINIENGVEISRSVDVTKIEKVLKDYLDDPTKHESWRVSQQFTGWRARTDEINQNNLAIVAWVQDADTKEVLQAFYFDVQ